MEKPLHVRVAERVKARVEVTPGGCWEWLGYRDRKGYGVFSINDRPTRVARASYEAFVRPIPDGLTIDHLCRNPPCVNPDHLEPVSRGENVLRGDTLTAKNKNATECPKGHAYDDKNTYTDSRGKRSCKTCRRAEAKSPEGRARAAAYMRARRAKERAALKEAGKL